MQTRKKTELEESRRNAARLMKRILTHFRAQMDEELRPNGITKAQVHLLWAIHNAPGSSGAHLARVCEVTPQTAQELIQKIEENGWIVRGKDSINDRIVTASLTAAGEDLLLKAEEIIKVIEARLWKDISAEAINKLNGVLEMCLKNIAPL